MINIKDYRWHIDDLMLVGKKSIKKKIEIQTFDLEYLDI